MQKPLILVIASIIVGVANDFSVDSVWVRVITLVLTIGAVFWGSAILNEDETQTK